MSVCQHWVNCERQIVWCMLLWASGACSW